MVTEFEQKALAYLKEKYQFEASGHDYFHLVRVLKNARQINEDEQQADHLIVLLSLFHDEFDEKFYQGDMVSDFNNLLHRLDIQISHEEFNQLVSDLQNFGFKGGFGEQKLSRIGQIVSDADRLDAIGAIGIARTFMYGGKQGFPMFSEESYQPLKSQKDYRQVRPTIWHFKDKLLCLKDLMYTKKAKDLAQERHDFMMRYLQKLSEETDFDF